jgi:predicted nucleic acid-binding protein
LRFVDANVFLYTLIGSPKRDFETSRAILKRVEEGEEAMTSLAVILEVVDWLEYNGRKKEAGVFLAAVNSYTEMKKVSNSWRDFPRASAEAEEAGIDFVDALTLAVMRREKIAEVYSNDKDFDRVAGIKRVFE